MDEHPAMKTIQLSLPPSMRVETMGVLLGVAALSGVVGSALLARRAAAAPEPVVTTMMTKELTDIPGKEAAMLTVTYPPGGADPVHRHNAHSFVYVLEGSVVMGVKGGKEATLKPGETFYEGPDDIHTVGRNASSTKPAKFVVFMLKDKGTPVLIPVQ
jgi:quercetin dioxygenase-like cupin family protein